jgi:hypothetical protein
MLSDRMGKKAVRFFRMLGQLVFQDVLDNWFFWMLGYLVISSVLDITKLRHREPAT